VQLSRVLWNFGNITKENIDLFVFNSTHLIFSNVVFKVADNKKKMMKTHLFHEF